ncbi:MAG: ABC transporter permease [Planctomycetes bacterium]|nr:ABC transporter permease [Planctomycetota bacterium]
MLTIRAILARKWLWSYLGALAVFGVIALRSPNPLATLSASTTFASFYILVGIGQMLVITTGPGNIDLSIPYTIAFAGSLAFHVMGEANAGIPLGIAAGLAGGAAVGACNYGLIRFVRMPPMIATLVFSFIIRSVTISFFRGMQIKSPAGLAWFVNQRLAGVPVIFLFALATAAVMQVALTRTAFGRYIHAIGQNLKAAWLCGIDVKWCKLWAYMLSGMFAGLTGILLAAFTGGATLDMGGEYMLYSIAVVVMGGSSIAGGNSNVIGIVGSAVLLYLIVNLLNMENLGAGWRYIFTGVVIVGTIFLSGDKIRRNL